MFRFDKRFIFFFDTIFVRGNKDMHALFKFTEASKQQVKLNNIKPAYYLSNGSWMNVNRKQHILYQFSYFVFLNSSLIKVKSIQLAEFFFPVVIMSGNEVFLNDSDFGIFDLRAHPMSVDLKFDL